MLFYISAELNSVCTFHLTLQDTCTHFSSSDLWEPHDQKCNATWALWLFIISWDIPLWTAASVGMPNWWLCLTDRLLISHQSWCLPLISGHSGQSVNDNCWKDAAKTAAFVLFEDTWLHDLFNLVKMIWELMHHAWPILDCSRDRKERERERETDRQTVLWLSPPDMYCKCFTPPSLGTLTLQCPWPLPHHFLCAGPPAGCRILNAYI